jgi:uncharacterized membrane protein
MIWIGVVAKDFYAKQIGYLMKKDFSFGPALVFYLLYIVGLVIFVILPAVNSGSWKHALLFGAFFGFLAYATYDLTNQATIRDWPFVMTVVDMAWGTILSAVVSVVTYFIAMRVGK